MNNFLTVHSNGFITYCDALIARLTYDKAQSFLFSLVGSPAHVQAASAHFISGGLCRVADAGNEVFELCRSGGTVHAIRAKKIGDIVNKIMISADHFPGRTDPSSRRSCPRSSSARISPLSRNGPFCAWTTAPPCL